jgi:hypothetical protein
MDIRDMQYNLDVGSTKILVAKAAFAKIHSQHLYKHGFSCKNGTTNRKFGMHYSGTAKALLNHMIVC